MKKMAVVMGILLTLVFAGTSARANTVSVYLDNIGATEISGFQLFFYEPDSTYGWPMETNWDTFAMDFTAGMSAQQTRRTFWTLETLIDADDTDNIDYARGIGGLANSLNSALKLNDGLLLTMSSADTLFAINLSDSRNSFFDFSDSPITGLGMSQSWSGGDQTVTISAVPIPGAIWLLASGLIGFLGIRRRVC